MWDVARFHPETEQGQAAADAADIVRTSSKKTNGSAGDESAALAHENFETPDDVANAAALPNDIELPAEAENGVGTDDAAAPEAVNGVDAAQADPDETHQTNNVAAATGVTAGTSATDGSPNGAVQPNQGDALRAAAANAAMVVGQVCGLMTVSPAHKHLFIADLEWALMPPVLLRQFSMVRQNDRLAAFVSWASVSDEVNARLKQGVTRLKPADWRSGSHLWIIDVIAPFGRRDEIVAQVRETVFAGKVVKVLAPGTNGRGDSF